VETHGRLDLEAGPITRMALYRGGEGEPDPAELARRLADYLDEELRKRGLSPREAWSFTVKLFGRSGTGNSASQLLEMADLRVRMSDHQGRAVTPEAETRG